MAAAVLGTSTSAIPLSPKGGQPSVGTAIEAIARAVTAFGATRKPAEVAPQARPDACWSLGVQLIPVRGLVTPWAR
jgi:hypothetical protein